ncbi:hypothetical protein [Pannonibacter tanglangensis]|uniref:Uncharacterized protein n=1 Tax=Pannonibacter tanglangensis TaxID=2750084 RepID=A0ABW9ZDQ1_9HYPH|nr:hypothetical protein [Pannonibacter sp. XCT-34]NBN62816.1 hypothetical protein [Pannonibacter sp. XCT-34]
MAGPFSTQITEQLAQRGITARDVRLQIAIAEYQNNGGTFEQAEAMLRAAYTNAAKGHNGHADEARTLVPDAAPLRGAGQLRSADKAMATVPAAPIPSTRSGGHVIGADEASVQVPPAPQPRREVAAGHARRGLAAIAAAQAPVARSLFDGTRLPDGRTLREVHWAECPRLARQYRHLARVLHAIHSHATPSDPAATLDEIVSEAQLKAIIATAERANDLD